MNKYLVGDPGLGVGSPVEAGAQRFDAESPEDAARQYVGAGRGRKIHAVVVAEVLDFIPITVTVEHPLPRVEAKRSVQA